MHQEIVIAIQKESLDVGLGEVVVVRLARVIAQLKLFVDQV